MSSIEDIQIEKVRANPANIRNAIDTDSPAMKRLQDEVRTMGLVEPLRVYPHPGIEGDYLLQDGHRRRLAAINAGLSTVPCLIVEAPVRGALEDIEIMMTTGRNHAQLSVLEEARGFQAMLDLGLNESTIGKKFKKPKSEVLAKARIDNAHEGVKKAYGFGKIDLEGAKRLQDLEDSGAEGIYEKVAERIGAEAERFGRVNVERTIAEAEADHEVAVLKAQLDALGVQEAPSDAGYSGKFHTAPEMTDEEHAAVGHLGRAGSFYTGSDSKPQARVQWFEKATKPAAAVSDDEKAEKEKFRALNGGLGISFRVRRTFLAKQVSDPIGGVNQAKDQEILFDLLWPDISRLDDELLGDITGIHKPGNADDDGNFKIRQEWLGKVKARFRAYTWRQLVRAAALYKYQDTDKQLRNIKNFDRTVYEWRTRKTWLECLQEWFGYELDQSEQDALEHFKAKGGTHNTYNLTPKQKVELEEHGRILAEDVEVL